MNIILLIFHHKLKQNHLDDILYHLLFISVISLKGLSAYLIILLWLKWVSEIKYIISFHLKFNLYNTFDFY